MDNGDVYLRSDKQLSVNCDVDSNPEATCEWLTSDEVLGNYCNAQLKLTTSKLLKCKAENSQYDSFVDEKSLNVYIVPDNRKSKKIHFFVIEIFKVVVTHSVLFDK